MHDSVQNSINNQKQLLIYHIYRFVLQECNNDNQQDKTQLLMKTAQNRWNRIADGMKQVTQHGWIIVRKTYFSLVPVKNYCTFVHYAHLVEFGNKMLSIHQSNMIQATRSTWLHSSVCLYTDCMFLFSLGIMCHSQQTLLWSKVSMFLLNQSSTNFNGDQLNSCCKLYYRYT